MTSLGFIGVGAQLVDELEGGARDRLDGLVERLAVNGIPSALRLRNAADSAKARRQLAGRHLDRVGALQQRGQHGRLARAARR